MVLLAPGTDYRAVLKQVALAGYVQEVEDAAGICVELHSAMGDDVLLDLVEQFRKLISDPEQLDG